jgi:hypothetical protein
MPLLGLHAATSTGVATGGGEPCRSGSRLVDRPRTADAARIGAVNPVYRGGLIFTAYFYCLSSQCIAGLAENLECEGRPVTHILVRHVLRQSVGTNQVSSCRPKSAPEFAAAWGTWYVGQPPKRST